MSVQGRIFKKKVIFPLIFIVILFLFTFALGEIYIRQFSKFEYITPEILKNRSLQYETSLFARGVFKQSPSKVNERDIKYYINEKGYRGHDFLIKKPKGLIRLIFYGGSAVFDIEQTEGKDWPHRVESILRKNGLTNVEVINAGIPGHASFDSFGRFFAEGHAFNPDYVIIYNAWNDFEYFRSNKTLLREFKPYVETSDPRLNYQNWLDRFLCRHLQLYVRLRNGYYNWKLHAGIEGQMPQGTYSSKLNESSLRQYRLNMEMFVALAHTIGAAPILMTQARLVSRNNTPEQKKRILYSSVMLTHEALCEAFEKTDEILRDIAKSKNAYLIDASKYLTGKDEIFFDHIHLTDKGSSELAVITARYLMELIKRRNNN